MMKNNLGKSVLWIFFLPLFLNAKVAINVSDTFYKNDVVQLSITASGQDIKMPDIKEIDGNRVQNGGTSKNITIINGKRSYQFVQSYIFRATKDVNVPAFEILVDNKVEKTKEKTIKMLEVSKTNSDLYDLTISVDKKEVYVGESIEFTLKFRYRKDLNIVGLDFKKPAFNNFWVKELQTKPKKDNTTSYVEQEIKYLLFPQKSGDIELDALKIGVSTVKQGNSNSFFLSQQTDTVNVYSNKLQLNVKALPQDIDLVGDFTIDASVDKTNINQGDAVSYKLYINGRGNIDDLEEIVLDIAGATIYDNPAKKEYNIHNNLYGGKYTKTYSIVGKENFTIPSVELKYFDKKSLKIKTIRTKAYDIQVKGEAKVVKKLEIAPIQNSLNKLDKGDKESYTKTIPSSSQEKVFFFVVGLVCGMIVIVLIVLFQKRTVKKEEIPLFKLVKKSATPQELFKVLFVYITLNEELDTIIYRLENLSLEEFKKEKKNILKSLQNIIQKDKLFDI